VQFNGNTGGEQKVNGGQYGKQKLLHGVKVVRKNEKYILLFN
jgi:hypothetical protein